MTKKAELQQERDDATEHVRELLAKSGTNTVYSIIRDVSRSGMTRWLDLFVVVENTPLRITWSVANILGWKYDTRREALKVEGCGMDMAFHTVYSPSCRLYCPGQYDHDAAYRLRSEVL